MTLPLQKVLKEVEEGVGITSLYCCCDWLLTGYRVKEEVLAGGYHPSILVAMAMEAGLSCGAGVWGCLVMAGKI